jgi:hypothetical protein
LLQFLLLEPWSRWDLSRWIWEKNLSSRVLIVHWVFEVFGSVLGDIIVAVFLEPCSRWDLSFDEFGTKISGLLRLDCA